MNIAKNLYWEKFRPEVLEDVVLPERIQRFVSNGIQTHMIFTGHAGAGKTTLARILTKNHPTLSLSAKLGVDMLRDKVKRFCQERADNPFGFDNNDAEQSNKPLLKVVYFEEFDRASRQLQEELKSFMEEYHDVRFLATSNSVNNLDKNLLSRFNIVDFSPQSTEEGTEIKKKYLVRIVNLLKAEGIDIPRETLKEIFTSKFPDFRSIWQDIQYYVVAGVTTSTQILHEDRLYEMIIQGSKTDVMWDYLMANWQDKMDKAFVMLGRNFYYYIQQNHPHKMDKIPEALNTLTEFTDLRLPNAVDPFVTLVTLVMRYQRIFA